MAGVGFTAYTLSGEPVVADLRPGDDGAHRVGVARRSLATALGVPRRRVGLFHVGNFDELESDEEVKGDVQLIVFPPRRVVTVSVDKSVVIWNADTGVCEIKWSPYVQSGNSPPMCFSLDGKRFATAWGDLATLWDVETRSAMISLKCPGTIFDMIEFSHDGMRLATCSFDHTMRIWNAETGICEVSVSGVGIAYSMSFSPDDRRLVVSGDLDCDLVLPIWNTCSGACEDNVPLEHDMIVDGVCFSPDGQRLALAWPCCRFSARIWRFETRVWELRLFGHGYIVVCLCFSSDGRRLATASGDNTARIWNAENGACELQLAGHSQALSSVRFSSDGRQVVTSSHDKSANIWNAKTGKHELTLLGDSQFADVLFLCS